MAGFLDRLLTLLNPSSTSEDVSTRSSSGSISLFPPEEKKQESVKIYPSQRYIDKNLAPEQTLTTEDISAIAKATKQAQDKGVLTPELASYLLPMAIVEGRSGNYGILTDALGLYPKSSTLKRFKDMDLGIGEPGKLHPSDTFVKDEKNLIRMIPNRGDKASMARTMATILAEKASLKGITSAEDAVKRYNGVGRAIEVVDNVAMQADVDVYLQKVKEAKRMLEHPKNKHVLEMFYREMALQK